MNRLTLVLVVVTLASSLALARGKKKPAEDADEAAPKREKHDAVGSIILNGEKTEVRWTDGDSFNIKSGEYKGKGTRLQGYNTLEAYGPVHSWGSWTPQELYEIARGSSKVAASQEWKCTTDGQLDGYKRLLIDCPDGAKELVRQGHAMVYAVEHTRPNPELVALQKEAQAKKMGMWAKGVVNGVISSLHSLGEDGDEQKESYNRVVDTRTGEALVRKHSNKYATCQTVCEETDGDKSCMVYVPFKRRYHGQPDCLLK
jgi:endonuclease YncB( thermonuclease family)